MATIDLTVTMLEGMWCIALKEEQSTYHLGASSSYDHIRALADRLAAQLIAEGHTPVIHHPVMSDALTKDCTSAGMR